MTAARPALAADLRRLFAFGTGVGIEIRGADLEIAAVRVRPSGPEILGSATIRKFRDRPAAEWGASYSDLLKRLGEGRLSATVVLPRSETIVRQLAFPQIASKDLQPAIAYQLDTLHPFGEDDVLWGWSPLAGGTVLVGIARRQVLEGYAAMFAEAGVSVAAFTFSAAVIHAGLRLFAAPPAEGFVALRQCPDGAVEVYGESPSRPLFSAEFETAPDRAVLLGAAELRLPPETRAVPLERVLPQPRREPEEPLDPLPYAAALAGACPRLAPAANLLPEAMRHSNSRAMFIPTAILAGLLVITATAVLAYNRIADRSYTRKLEQEIALLEPHARQAAALDRQTDQARARVRLLDEFRGRTRADLDALQELTKLLPPPIWTSSIDLTPDSASINGEAEQAAGLIKVIDASPFFRNSEFSVIARTGSNELFRIHTMREGRK